MTIFNRRDEKDFDDGFKAYVDHAGTVNPLFNGFLMALQRIALMSDEEVKRRVAGMEPDQVPFKRSLKYDRYNLMVGYLSSEIIGPKEDRKPIWVVRDTLAEGLEWEDHIALLGEAVDGQAKDPFPLC